MSECALRSNFLPITYLFWDLTWQKKVNSKRNTHTQDDQQTFWRLTIGRIRFVHSLGYIGRTMYGRTYCIMIYRLSLMSILFIFVVSVVFVWDFPLYEHKKIQIYIELLLCKHHSCKNDEDDDDDNENDDNNYGMCGRSNEKTNKTKKDRKPQKQLISHKVLACEWTLKPIRNVCCSFSTFESSNWISWMDAFIKFN